MRLSNRGVSPNSLKSPLPKKRLFIYSGFFALMVLVVIVTYIVTTTVFPNGVKQKLFQSLVERGYQVYGDKGISDSLMSFPRRYLWDNESAPNVTLDIKFKHVLKLNKKRSEAMEKGILVQAKDDFVPAKIRVDNRTIKCKLRLKGDWTDHLSGNKWSFRVHIKGKNHFFGMRRFSIQHPKTRDYQGEVLYLETLRHYGVLAPKYFFINVRINGNNIGLMAVEEHFSKELLERNGRKEGIILRFDESLVWESNDGKQLGFDGAFDSYYNAPIDAFRSKKVRKSQSLAKQYKIAVGMMRGFISNQLKPSQVFDVGQMGRFLAVSEIWGAWHSLRWHNLRFYLNPLTMRLEPIGFDANIGKRRPPGISAIYAEAFVRDVLQDPEMQRSFSLAYEKISQDVDNNSLIDFLRVKEESLLKVLHGEFYFLENVGFEPLRKRSGKPNRLAASLFENRYARYVHAYTVEDNAKHYLELFNAVPHDVVVESVRWRDKNNNPIPFKSNITFPVKLPKTPVGSRAAGLRLEYTAPENNKLRLDVSSRMLGDGRVKSVFAVAGYPSLTQDPMPSGSLQSLKLKYKFLAIDEGNKTVSVKPGVWQIREPIAIPRGFQFFVNAGTKLQFAENANLVIYGTSIFKGSKQHPIILENLPTTKTWQGVAVFFAGKRSAWANVVVRNTSGIKLPNWSLTGGVTFYKSDVDLVKCTFLGNIGEDALNIVHSDFTITDIHVSDTASDAFDGDFVTGKVIGGLFQNIGLKGGGDGIDISGSNISVTGSRFNNVLDKALSVGEGSIMNASKIFIEDSSVGAASKDRSKLSLTDSTILRAKNVALMAYVKKPEYGPAQLLANQVKIEKSERLAQAQLGSTLSLNGKIIEPEDLNVKRMYDTKMKSGVKR